MKISVITPSIRPEGLKPNQEALASQGFDDFEWLVEMGIPNRGHDLNAAFNRMLKRAKGELIVFMEDWTKCTTDGLQRFWDAYQSEPEIFWTAPLGKTLDWKQITWDGRAYADASDIPHQNWEIDWGAAPKDALFKTGGFDEELDQYWSCDNLSVAFRAKLLGYKFKNLFNNPAVAFDHDANTPHPFRSKFNPEFNTNRMREVEMGNLTIDYLH